MYPGRVTRVTEEKMAAAATIRPRTDIIYVTGATPISVIVPTFGARAGQMLFVIAAGSPITFATGGNIYGGGTLAADRCAILLWSRLGSGANGWVLNAGVAP